MAVPSLKSEWGRGRERPHTTLRRPRAGVRVHVYPTTLAVHPNLAPSRFKVLFIVHDTVAGTVGLSIRGDDQEVITPRRGYQCQVYRSECPRGGHNLGTPNKIISIIYKKISALGACACCLVLFFAFGEALGCWHQCQV